MVDSAHKANDEEDWTTATSGSISPEQPAFDSSSLTNEDNQHPQSSKMSTGEELSQMAVQSDAVLMNNLSLDVVASDEPTEENSFTKEIHSSRPADAATAPSFGKIAGHSSLDSRSETANYVSPLESEDVLMRKMEWMESSPTSSFLPSAVDSERPVLKSLDSSFTQTSPSQPNLLLSSTAVEHETDTWLKEQHRQHTRQPSIIAEEKDISEEGDRDHLTRLAKAAEKSQLPLPPSLKSWDNMQALLQEAEKIEQDQKIEPTAPLRKTKKEPEAAFLPQYRSTHLYATLSKWILRQHYTPFTTATWIGFWALSHVTCANHVLTPMRDAIALQIGVAHVPKLTLVSMLMAFCSSVPIGWLFEAPDPSRRRLWKKMGLTRGETQGTSLALFYRCFAFVLISYAAVFEIMHLFGSNEDNGIQKYAWVASILGHLPTPLLRTLSLVMYVAFFLIVHLMKLHSISLMWGVTTEAMEYEEVAQKKTVVEQTKTRLQRMALVSFGGTVGGILGSFVTSVFASLLRLSGLLLISAIMLEISAELSIELGRVMQKHWEEQQLFQSNNDLTSLDSSMKRSSSLGTMKRVASGNSIARVKSASDLSSDQSQTNPNDLEDNTFSQRLLRGAKTILRSRLLMSIFTYNALYASTNVLLSFQRAELVAGRTKESSVQQDTAFLANINMASSVAIFVLQATGAGSFVAATFGPRGTLSLMPLARLAGALYLAWWHNSSSGKPPNLFVFLIVDEFCKVMNMAVAKPVRESLWRGLSNEARYEAKPIVDTLANRWGGGSAAFLVSFLNKSLDLLHVEEIDGQRNVFGFPPILVLCATFAAWWTMVSADLGLIRHNIDVELKKRQ